jgi:hypothetical protein
VRRDTADVEGVDQLAAAWDAASAVRFPVP